MNKDHNDIIAFQVKRMFNVLAKRMLVLFEDLQSDHNIHFDKLRRNLDDEFQTLIEQADYFDDAKFNHYRKRILDSMGDGFREINEELAKYDLRLKE